LNQKIIFPSSSSKEVKITLNIQDFEPSAPAPIQSDIENDQQALEEATKQLFEKIASASTEVEEAEPPTQETTKQIFEKIAAESKKVSLSSTTEEALEKARLAKVEQKRLKEEKRQQEALAKEKAIADEKARVEKLEQARLNTLAIAAAKEKARLADIEQKRLEKEKKKQEALAKALQKKQEKLKKQKLAKARKLKAHKKKLRKQKLAKKRRQQQAKKQKQARRKSNDPLANAIMSASTSMSPTKSRRPAMRMIKQFYGSEFNSFTKTQKRFIEKNLGSIYQITQRTLTRNGYPSVAAKTHQQGTQIVTFYLHPNGRITGLKLKKRIGHASLDKNTLRVIRIAYKDYPRPKTKTKITFYVEYSLF
jgi:TonB family protein